MACFFLPLLRNVVLRLKRTSTKNLQKELVTKYDTNDASKESLVGESKSAKGGVHIRCDTGTTYEFFEVIPAIQRNPRLQVNFVSFRPF